MNQNYNVLIIGAGKIAAEFDDPNDNKILTHAHAITQMSNLNLVGFVDIDHGKAISAAEKWNCEAFSSIEEAIAQHQIEIAVVAVPDQIHYSVLKQLSSYNFKGIVVEKPLATRLDDANELIQIYNKKNIPLWINYTRRFLPEFLKIKSNIEKNFYGQFLFGTGYYGKGIIHNGSHLIDLIRFLYSNIVDIEIMSYSYDYYKDDPSVSAILRLKDDKPFYLQYVDCQDYTIFEIDLIFDKSRIKILNSGFQIEVFMKQENSDFKGYHNLVKKETLQTMLDRNMIYLYENVYDGLSDSNKIICTAEDAKNTLVDCIAIKDTAENLG